MRDCRPEIVQAVRARSAALLESVRGRYFAGWRLTHRQAQAVLPIARRSGKSCLRYADGALLASLLQDDLLATSLQERYLSPLASERDGGRTLRAYFAANRNASSAAAALGVNRYTIANRLRIVEERVGRSLASAGAEIEAALRLHDLDDGARQFG